MLASPPDRLTALPLPDWSAILARGPEAASFLHTQLSNDVLHLGEDAARLAAYCNAKGRMLASFVVARYGDALALLLPTELLSDTKTRLARFVLRAKLELRDARDEGLQVAGLCGLGLPAAGRAQSGAEGLRLLGLPPAAGLGRALVLGPAQAVDAHLAHADALARARWDELSVRSAVVPVVAATVEHFVPQMINYDVVGGVDFKKGCYPGQEVVARSHYLGKLKRRGALLRSVAPLDGVRPGDDIVWSEDPGQPCGEVALAARDASGAALIFAELKRETVGRGSLHWRSADGARLQTEPLPYALPD